MSIEPLWPLALLAVLYRAAHWIVPYAVKLARGGIIFTAILIFPALVYANLYGSPARSNHVSPHIQVFVDLAYAGILSDLPREQVCFFVDARRGPCKSPRDSV